MGALKLDIPTSNEWHILKGETQYGPYTYEEMIQLLQNKTLFGFDYVWSPHLDQWTPCSDLAEFSVDRLTRLAERTSESDVFFRRKHERVLVSLEVLVHNSLRVWSGTVENLSEGGALILMDNPLLLPGEIVTIHFRKLGESSQSFNCTAEILTKRLTKQRIQHDTRLYYAVKFQNMHENGKKQIPKWLKEFSKEK